MGFQFSCMCGQAPKASTNSSSYIPRFLPLSPCPLECFFTLVNWLTMHEKTRITIVRSHGCRVIFHEYLTV